MSVFIHNNECFHISCLLGDEEENGGRYDSGNSSIEISRTFQDNFDKRGHHEESKDTNKTKKRIQKNTSNGIQENKKRRGGKKGGIEGGGKGGAEGKGEAGRIRKRKGTE